MSEEKNTNGDFLGQLLLKGNPRVPIVTYRENKAYVLGFLRFVRAHGKISIGTGQNATTVEGSTCGIELVIRKDMWDMYKKAKIQVGDNYIHMRVQMLSPQRLLLLARRLEQMAYMLLVDNILRAQVKGASEEKEEEKEEVDLDIERM